MRWVTFALLAGCGAPARAPADKTLGNAKPDEDAAQLVLASEQDIRLVAVSHSGTHVLRSATVPERIDELEWVQSDPIVLLQQPMNTECAGPEVAYKSHAAYEAALRECMTPGPHEGVIGRLTQRGFVPYARLPESTWDLIAQKPGGEPQPCGRGCWSLEVKGAEVWQGHCKWTFMADGTDHCQEWAYARIDQPGPATLKYPLAGVDEPRPELPNVPPSPRVDVTFEAITPPPHYDGDEPEAVQQMHCALDGKEQLVYPAVAELDRGMMPEVTWLATDPPMFAAYHMHDGFAGWSDTIVMEGCTRTAYDRIIAAHAGLVAVVSDSRIEVLRNGKRIGATDGANLVLFAPVNEASR